MGRMGKGLKTGLHWAGVDSGDRSSSLCSGQLCGCELTPYLGRQ